MIFPLEQRTLFAAATPLEQQMVDLINAARANPEAACAAVGVSLNQDLPTGTIPPGPKSRLTWDSRLADAADGWANWLLNNGMLEHGWGGSTPQTRVDATGYHAAVVLENAGVSLTSAVYWMPSLIVKNQSQWYVAHEGHRAQEFDPRTSNIGVGIAVGTWNGYPAMVSVIEFASPATRPVKPVFDPVWNDTIAYPQKEVGRSWNE